MYGFGSVMKNLIPLPAELPDYRKKITIYLYNIYNTEYKTPLSSYNNNKNLLTFFTSLCHVYL